jgi:Leucine-rich repeat (LRR) protein
VLLSLFGGLALAAESVKSLQISRQNAAVLDQIGGYTDLEVLSIVCVESLQSLPDSIGQLTKLRELNVDNGNGCSMNPVLPESIGNLRSLEKLVLYGAQDPRLPHHQLAERHPFPRSMSQLKNLQYLDLGRNGLETAGVCVEHETQRGSRVPRETT